MIYFCIPQDLPCGIITIPQGKEGDERFSNKESIRFLYIANGSVAEVITQLTIAHEIGYVDTEIFNNLIEELGQISKMIKNLIKYRIDNDKNK
jgi:four helix bundle protein